MAKDNSSNASKQDEEHKITADVNRVEPKAENTFDGVTPETAPTSNATSTTARNDDVPSKTKSSSPKEVVENQQEDFSVRVKVEEDDICIGNPIPFSYNPSCEIPAFPIPISFSADPSRKLLFEEERNFGLLSSPHHPNINGDDGKVRSNAHSVHYHETPQPFESPAPGLDGMFPSSYLEEMGSFPPLQNPYQIDDSYNSNLLGGAFIPSPNDPVMSSSNITHLHPFLTNIPSMHDIQVQHHGPMLNCTKRDLGSTQDDPYEMKDLPKLDSQVCSDDADSEKAVDNKRSIGKTLDNLNQISASTTKRRKSTRPQSRKVTRNLPLRKRHTTLDQSPQLVLKTPMASTRSQTRNMVSRSTSGEKKKKEPLIDVNPSRNRSRRQSSTYAPRTASTSAARFNDNGSDQNASFRVIQHFTPKRHTNPILSVERSLPTAVILGCKCSKSKCLKLYCDCFQAGQVCADRCSCKSCLNTVGESGKTGRRTAAIQSILDRRPDAFDVRVKKTGEGCSCKKNKCLKKYCDCYNIGIKCDEEKCRCVDCENYPSAYDRHGDDSSVSYNDENDQIIDYEDDEEVSSLIDIETPFTRDDDEQTNFTSAAVEPAVGRGPRVSQKDIAAV